MGPTSNKSKETMSNKKMNMCKAPVLLLCVAAIAISSAEMAHPNDAILPESTQELSSNSEVQQLRQEIANLRTEHENLRTEHETKIAQLTQALDEQGGRSQARRRRRRTRTKESKRQKLVKLLCPTIGKYGIGSTQVQTVPLCGKPQSCYNEQNYAYRTKSQSCIGTGVTKRGE